MDEVSTEQARINEEWRTFMTNGDRMYHRMQQTLRRVPASPRCKLCFAPFRGPGGYIMRLMGRSPAKMNPRICNACEHYAREHPGGAEVPLTMLFADIRGSTTLAESLGTTRFTSLIARFYDAVTTELIRADALIDRLIGDEVIALFVPGVAGNEHAQAAVQVAQNILKSTGHENSGGPWVPLGVGVHTGNAFVGSVGSAGVSDITALGDDVNLTARLASLTSAGEILITEAARAAAGLATHGLEPRHLQLKGRTEPVDAWLMRIGANVTA